MPIKTREIILIVSAERFKEWAEFVDGVRPTHQNPIPGDRILASAWQTLELQKQRKQARHEDLEQERLRASRQR